MNTNSLFRFQPEQPRTSSTGSLGFTSWFCTLTPLLTSLAWSATLFLGMAAFQTTAHAAHTVVWADCGGEGEIPCDAATRAPVWALLPTTQSDNVPHVNDTLRCDRTLMIHDFGSAGGIQCVNKNRHQIQFYDPKLTTPDLAFGLQNLSTVQADLPINYEAFLGTSDSYSNMWDGTGSPVNNDQGYTISDQLDYGARAFRLDPWYNYANDNQIYLCHGISGSLCDLNLSSVGMGQMSLNRPFFYAIKEIGHWVKAHPTEFIVLYLHDGYPNGFTGITVYGTYPEGGSWQNVVSDSSSPYYLTALQKELGGLVYINDSASSGNLPSLRQMRAAGKQVLVISSYSSDWAFPADLLADSTGPDKLNASTCIESSGSSALTRTAGTFAGFGEDRSLSIANTDSMVDGPRLAGGLACGYNFIGLDFLGTLNQAGDPAQLFGGTWNPLYIYLKAVLPAMPDPSEDYQCNDFSNPCNTTENRREAFVWNYQPGIAEGTSQAVQMSGTKANHSWQRSDPSSLAPFLCAGPSGSGGFPNTTNPLSYSWKTTNNTGPWGAGETRCQAEFGSNWHFWHPASSAENVAAWDAMKAGGFDAAWINHWIGSIVSVPQTLSLSAQGPNATFTPATLVISGGFGGALKVTSSDSTNLTAVLNGNLVTVTPVNESYGVHEFTITISETNPMDQSKYQITVPVRITVSEPLVAKPASLTLSTLASQSIQILNPDNTPAGGLTLSTPKVSWLQAALTGNTVTVSLVGTGNLPTGTYSTSLSVSTSLNSAGLPVTIPISFSVTACTIQPGQSGAFSVDGTSYTQPQTFVWFAGTRHTLGVAQTSIGSYPAPSILSYSGWSGAGASGSTLTVPAQGPNTYQPQYSSLFLVQVSSVPATGGTTTIVNQDGTAASTTYRYVSSGTILAVNAAAASGYLWTNFTFLPNVTPQEETATFARLVVNQAIAVQGFYARQLGNPSLTASVSGSITALQGGQVNVPIRIFNAGPGYAGLVQLGTYGVSVVATTLKGSGQVWTSGVVNYGALDPGHAGIQNVMFNWPDTATEVQITLTFSAYVGTSNSYSGSTTLTISRQ